MGPPRGDPPPTTVEYEPVSVKDLLVEMKDTSEHLIDLSYSAVLLNNGEIATEVLRLEERMDVLQLRARMSLLMAARNPADAEKLAPVLGIVSGAEKISDAAGDIAKVVLEEVGLPSAMRAALPEAVETLVRASVEEDSPYAGRTLLDINLESETGVRVIAIRRGSEWILNPGPDTEIRAEDVTLLRGPDAGIEDVYGTITGVEYSPPEIADSEIEDLDRAVDSIVLMKNLSELAVDLAYGSILFDTVELAEEVRNLEVEVDALRSRFEAWTLRAAGDAPDPVALRGLLHLGFSTEEISDAALEISEGILREIDVHPVVELAVQESDEIIVRVSVESGSAIEDTSLVDGVPESDVSMNVLAVRRPEAGWMLVPDADTQLQGGDVLIAKGTRTSAETFRALASA
ncbi:potassium channel family protein [Halalkalicoccus jeotgali]|uniref:TrkA-C domain protein n=1 Tax=Halalkalicoccus jeotgali (strain DSM 18796 / CECT 7217 / JCM 14584 / KCTC 4019 / B3) TaxID=795797 RepID=D8J8A9_HALJB|nr:potassium channel family protein [Halalkalicoccus jeotgali]ADJ16155.1 TrkA-C domain protein [Halalkalicoccus jeotgali B3]ELY37584.1 TrkA-C domain-containing protein [Halalkalicoccus jeotgali B3]